MNTNQPVAFGTGPPLLFVFEETPYAELLHVYEIVDHAHAIPGPVALIQVVQPVARKPVTAEAVPGFTFPYPVTSLDPAGDAGLWLAAVVAPATGACVLIPGMCNTEAAVHATGGNQRRSDLVGCCRFYRCHVRIPAEACIAVPFLGQPPQ